MEKQQNPNFIFFENGSVFGEFNAAKIAFNAASSSFESVPSLVHNSVTHLHPDHDNHQTEDHEKLEASSNTQQQIDSNSLVVDYRLISAAVIFQQSYYGTVAMDFSDKDGKILKGSTRLLKELPVMYDHHTSVRDWLGLIEKTEWTDEINKKAVPGINGRLNLDVDPDEKHPSRRIIRGIEKGVLNSFSVSVWFDYKRSHPDMDAYDFFKKMGQVAKDGEMIRLIVTKIRRYFEGSIVYAGADPLAKRKYSSQRGESADLAASMHQFAAFSPYTGWDFPGKEQTMLVNKPPKNDTDPAGTVEPETDDVELQANAEPTEPPVDDSPDTKTDHTNQELIRQNADLLTKCSELSGQIETLKETLKTSEATIKTLEETIDGLTGQLETKNNELEKALKATEDANTAFSEYKEATEARLSNADIIEKRFREDTVATYNRYALTFKTPISDETKQKRISAILGNMPIEQVLESAELWQTEFESTFPEGRKSKETQPADTNNEDRPNYAEQLAVVDDSVL